ncbi:MAG: hypothetical protein AB7T06_18345 [Kofleriaceae bacterium]
MRHVLALFLVASAASAARGETPIARPSAIDIERDTSPPGRPELGFDGGAPLDGGWAATVQLGWLERPLVFTTPDGESFPVARRQTVFLGGALALGPSAVVDVRLPIAHQTGDRLMLAGGGGEQGALAPWVAGDLHVGLRARVTGRPSFSVFARADIGFPTGDEDNFAGDSGWNLAWSLIGRFGLPAGISLSVAGGIRLRGDEVIVADRVQSNELFAHAGIAVPIPPVSIFRPLWCVAEQVKLTAEVGGVLGDRVAGAQGPSPIEARLGLVTHPRDNITLGFRVGAGLVDDEIGAPRWRALVELTLWGNAQVSSLLPVDNSPETEGESDVSDIEDTTDPDRH